MNNYKFNILTKLSKLSKLSKTNQINIFNIVTLSLWSLIILRKLKYQDKIILENHEQKILSIYSTDRLLYDINTINIEENNIKKQYNIYTYFPTKFKICSINKIIYGRNYL